MYYIGTISALILFKVVAGPNLTWVSIGPMGMECYK